jgi:hypothetical protein|nr:MAG TPA: hypothetical protein [Caudoviricetes sp.]
MTTKYYTNGYETTKENFQKAFAMALDADLQGYGLDMDSRIEDGVQLLFINNVPQLF